MLREQDKMAADSLLPSLLSLATSTQPADPEVLTKSISRSPDLGLEPERADALAERLQGLLRTSAVESTGHAIEILTQNPRNYGGSRVFTDVRHVFGRDPQKTPTGATVLEILQLQTWGPDGASDTIYVAMDETDLRELQTVVDRALKKTKTVRDMLEQQNLTYFQLDPPAA